MKVSGLPVIGLKPGREQSVLRFHPWIFSGAILHKPDGLSDGDIVEVRSSSGNFLGKGFYQDATISIKLFEFADMVIDRNYWLQKFKTAFNFRSQLNLTHNSQTNIYRLIHSEGDGVPGLVADFFNGTIVMQCHNLGTERLRDTFASVLLELYDGKLKVIYDKSEDLYGQSTKVITEPCLFGMPINTIAHEHGHLFLIDYVNGQKTGFFIDQRENRKLLGNFSADKTILNTFSYTGGFSIYALVNHAKKVVSVDTSKHAIEMVEENIRLNGIDHSKHEGLVEDVKIFLRNLSPNEFDIIILDPPAFAKTHKVSHNALQGYKYINRLAIEKVNHNGLIFTFSCSQAIDKSMFQSMVQSAAIEARRNVKIIGHLSQAPDHPINIFHPEGEYLKGLILWVE